jgi:predicted metal-binding protein
MDSQQKSHPRKIREKLSEAQILDDLQSYLKAASEMKDISDAVIVGSESIFIDPRVPFKCSIPKCRSYGTCANCPPHAISAEETQKLVDCYQYAIFVKKMIRSGIVTGEHITKAGGSETREGKAKLSEAVQAYFSISKAVTELESMAFYDGYFLAMGFAAGSCKKTLCGKFARCQALECKGCRHPNFARPSMEASGFNVFKMAARVGWDVYPIGGTCQPGDVPMATLMGLVLIT